MILNLRVDHKIANIDAMENIAKEMDQLFLELQEKYSIVEYVEISTCNRKEYYIHNDNIDALILFYLMKIKALLLIMETVLLSIFSV